LLLPRIIIIITIIIVTIIIIIIIIATLLPLVLRSSNHHKHQSSTATYPPIILIAVSVCFLHQHLRKDIIICNDMMKLEEAGEDGDVEEETPRTAPTHHESHLGKQNLVEIRGEGVKGEE